MCQGTAPSRSELDGPGTGSTGNSVSVGLCEVPARGLSGLAGRVVSFVRGDFSSTSPHDSNNVAARFAAFRRR